MNKYYQTTTISDMSSWTTTKEIVLSYPQLLGYALPPNLEISLKPHIG
jgi:hypothetical protein